MLPFPYSGYALLAAFAGFRYPAVGKTLWFGPQSTGRPFTTFFSTATGYGTVSRGARALKITVLEGELAMERITLTQGKATLDIATSQVARPGQPAVFQLRSPQGKIKPPGGLQTSKNPVNPAVITFDGPGAHRGHLHRLQTPKPARLSRESFTGASGSIPAMVSGEDARTPRSGYNA